MNRLPLTTTHAKRVSDAYSRVPCSQSVIFTHGLYFNIPEALPHNKISAWPWANISQRTYMSLLLWPPVDLRNRMLCISKANISIISNFIFLFDRMRNFGLSTMGGGNLVCCNTVCSKIGFDPGNIVFSL